MILIFLISFLAIGAKSSAVEQDDDEDEIRYTPQLDHDPKSVWSTILFNTTKSQVSRDFLTERLVLQMFNETVKPKLSKPGNPLDPLLLWPIGPEEFKKTMAKGRFRACKLYLHNLKSIDLKEFEVQRDQKMTFQAIRAKVEIPKLLVTGFYSLSKSKIAKVIKADSKGDFNITIDEIKVEAIITLKTSLELDTLDVLANNTLKIQDIDLHIEWKKMKFKFQGLRVGMRHITHWLLNKVVASKIVKRHGDKIDSLVEEYLRSLLECLMFHSSMGFEACDLQFWLGKGWSYPENFFECDD